MLAQSAARRASQGDSSSVITVLALIAGMIVLVVIAGFVLVRLRKRSTEGDDQADGLMMDDLRRLKDAGTLSDLEFQTLRRAMTEKSIAKIDAKLAARTRQPPTGNRLAPHPGEPPVRDNERRARPGFDLTGEPLPKTPPPE